MHHLYSIFAIVLPPIPLTCMLEQQLHVHVDGDDVPLAVLKGYKVLQVCRPLQELHSVHCPSCVLT